MFEQLTDRLSATFKKLRSRGKLHPKQVDKALGEIRDALLDADVAIEVADSLLARVRERSLGEEVTRSVAPGQQVVKVVSDEMTATLGGEHRPFTLPDAAPVVILMAGVQGSGKTTTCAKLAHHLKGKGRRVLLCAADLARPAAIDQLFLLGEEVGVPVVSDGKDPVKVAKSALRQAKKESHDILIVDTAGRLHVDQEMMREVGRVRDMLKPHHSLMAADAMTGQDAVRQAKAFMEHADLSGFVLTKVDGDARGGAALSITEVTGRPIFFAGVGESPKDLEPFHPDRMASRILGMGDVVSLVEKAQREMDEDAARESAEKMLKAEFSLEDFLVQLREVKKLGPLQDILAMLPAAPGGGNLKDLEVDENELVRAEAIISSMTLEERRNPTVLNGSRRSRVAVGSGTSVSQINSLLKQYDETKKMMKRLGGGGLGGLAKGLGGLGGMKLPKGLG